jgi:hypothetical protein
LSRPVLSGRVRLFTAIRALCAPSVGSCHRDGWAVPEIPRVERAQSSRPMRSSDDPTGCLVTAVRGMIQRMSEPSNGTLVQALNCG